MNLRILLLLAGVSCALGQRLPEDFDPVRAEREGRELTAELLSQFPANNFTNVGILEIKKRRSDPVEIPIRFTVLVFGNRWISRYEALGTDTNETIDALTIVHEPGKPSRYFRGAPEDLDHATPLAAGEVATLRFAGSDYWACDLGLEFLRWPVQRLLKKELRSSQSCNVLESIHTNAPTGGYSRVVSWLDIDTGGVVFAESYDAKRRRLKEFAPKSFKKVDGEWQLEEMRIEDLKIKSKSTFQFDVDRE
jgi:hypothetical protein